MWESSPRLILREKAVAEMQRPFFAWKNRGRRRGCGKLSGVKASPFGSNGDDRRQRRKQGGAVGAAASRMQATAKQTLGAAPRAVALRSNDGEGKLLSREPPHSDKLSLCQSDAIAVSALPRQRPCPLRRFAPALPKGEPQAERLYFAVPFCEFVENARFG